MVTLNERKSGTALAAAVATVLLVLACAIVAFGGVDADVYHQAPEGAVEVGSQEEFASALASEADVIDIVLTDDFEVSSALEISGSKTVNIYGNGHTITATGDSKWTGSGEKYMLDANGDGTDDPIVNVYDTTFDSNGLAYGLNFYKCTAELDNVASVDSAGAGFVVGNSADVTATNISASGYSWGGVNVDKGGNLNLDTVSGVGSAYSENSNGSTNTIDIEDAPVSLDTTISGAEYEAYYASADELAKYYPSITSSADTNTVNIGISGSTTLSTDLEIKSNTTLNVEEGATLTVASTSKVTNSGTVNIQGGLALRGEYSGSANVEGSFTAYSGSVFSDIDFTGDGDIDLSAGSERLTIDGGTYTDSRIEVHQNQILEITGDVYLSGSSTIDVQGTLIISEGANVYLRDKAGITVQGSAAGIQVLGGLHIENASESGSLVLKNNATAEISGTLEVSGDEDTKGLGLSVDGTVDITGTLAIQEFGNAKFSEDTKVNVGPEGSLVVNGTIQSENGGTTYSNAGTFTVNGHVHSNMNIDMTQNGADVVVSSLTKAEGAGSGWVVVSDGENKVTVKPNSQTVSGLTITRNAYGEETALDISGTVNTTAESTTEHIVTAGNTTVSDTLSLGQNVKMTSGSDIDVSGSMNATSVGSQIANNGTFTVTNDGTARTSTALTGKVTAARYLSEDGGTNVYRTLSNAVADGATEIDLLGDYIIDSDVTIPYGTTVRYSGNVVIGTPENDEVTVTVEEGGALLKTGSGSIDVLGTLRVEDADSGVSRNPSITSDVISESDPSVTYTNIMSALAGTTSGTITLSRDATVDRDAVLAEGVTLDTAGYDLTVLGCTLTVDGTLFLDGSSLILQDAAGYVPRKASVSLGGTVMSYSELTQYSESIPGAYYSVTDRVQGTYHYIRPVEDAVGSIADADGQTMTVHGDNRVSDISVSGTGEGAHLVVEGTLHAGGVTLENADLTVSGNGSFTGTVSAGTGSVEMTGTGDITARPSEEGDAVDISGSPSGPVEVTSGKATVEGELSAGGNLAVSEGATLEVSGTLTYDDMTVDGNLSVLGGANVTGTDGGTLTVMGSMTVAGATQNSAAGRVDADILRVGMSADLRTTSSATVEGVADYNTMYASAGSSVPQSMIQDRDHTAFHVSGSLWMTVYNDGEDVKVDYAPVENGVFRGWEGESHTYAKGQDVTIGEETDLHADARYDIYSLEILADEGIGSIAVDGNLMQKNGNMFTMSGLTAGTHTITYTLRNGFEGTAELTVSGSSEHVKVDGDSFTLSGVPDELGDDEYVEIDLSLGGTSTAAPAEPVEEGMGLTEYLLIVLVVLIVIMAVMVAMRLMRS